MEHNDIIKALECCYDNNLSCSDCPFQATDKYLECSGLTLSALALIKELTEENERLKADKGYAQGVRDFAERVKNYYRHMTSKALPATVEYYIDQIEKEMLNDAE